MVIETTPWPPTRACKYIRDTVGTITIPEGPQTSRALLTAAAFKRGRQDMTPPGSKELGTSGHSINFPFQQAIDLCQYANQMLTSNASMGAIYCTLVVTTLSPNKTTSTPMLDCLLLTSPTQPVGSSTGNAFCQNSAAARKLPGGRVGEHSNRTSSGDQSFGRWRERRGSGAADHLQSSFVALSMLIQRRGATRRGQTLPQIAGPTTNAFRHGQFNTVQASVRCATGSSGNQARFAWWAAEDLLSPTIMALQSRKTSRN